MHGKRAADHEMRFRLPRAAWRLVLLIAVLALPAGCGIDRAQVGLCEKLIPAIEPSGAEVRMLGHEIDPAAENAVRVHYRARDRDGSFAQHWISCRFAGSGFETGRLSLAGVVTDREGALSEVELFMLRRFWLGSFEAQAPDAPSEAAAEGAFPQLPYLLQLLINAVAAGCVYGLLAIGYTLVYGIIGRINFAFGEMAMIGGYLTVIGIAIAVAIGDMTLPATLLLVLLLAMLVGAAYGLATERVVFRPLRGLPSQAVLIATIGLSIFLQEFVRLAQGSNGRWLQPVFTAPRQLIDGGGFTVTLTTAQLLIPVATLVLYSALFLLLRRSRFGRAHRACADDFGMAALCGLDVDRTVMLTFAVGAGYAAVGGLIITLSYGSANFYMGFLIGLKALTAAILGGIGSVPGAMLGGVLIGLLETLWSGYLDMSYRDVAVLGVLIVTLVLRPNGLLGAREPAMGFSGAGVRGAAR